MILDFFKKTERPICRSIDETLTPWGPLKNTLKNLAFYSYFLQETDELVIARDVFPTAENNAVAASLVSGCGK